MTRSLKSIIIFLIVNLGALSGTTGCLPSKRLTVGCVGMLVEDVAKASAKQTDVSLITEGSPAYLMLLDGMVEAYPENRRLLFAASEAYRSYAAIQATRGNAEHASRLYIRGKDYALRAMRHREQFRSVLSQPVDALAVYVSSFSKKDVPVLFSFASCWAGWIGANPESVRAMADLPRVILLMERVIVLEETHDYGGAHLFMGIYKSAVPPAYGGKPEEARRHFERAIEIGGGDFLMAYVYYADHYARKTLKGDLFTDLLTKVIESPADRIPELTLINTIAQTRAEEMLSHAEEYF